MSNPSGQQGLSTRPPFDMPLQGGDYGDDIMDNAGKLVANLYGDERDPGTRKQRDYVIRAINSFDDMLAALKAIRGMIGLGTDIGDLAEAAIAKAEGR